MFTRPTHTNTILLVANYRPDVGFAWWLMENFWVEFSHVAKQHGMRVMLAYPESGAIPETIRNADITTVTQSFPGSQLLEIVAAISLIRSNKIKAIYLTDRNFSSWLYVLLRCFGVKIIINHDHTPGDRPALTGLRGYIKSLLNRFAPATADMQLCVSPLIQARAISNGKIPPDKTHVIQNGIVPLALANDPHYAHRTFGLPVDSKICITVGRASRYKRIDFAVHVAHRCIHTHGINNLAFIHCGDGPELENLKRLAATANLEGHFIFAGRRTDVPKLLGSSDYALHAAQGEAFSLAVLEYMSAGLAVLVPSVPSVCQAITHNKTGLVYRENDIDAAVSLLKQLICDEPLRRRLGHAAAAEVRERYDLTKMNNEFRQTVDSLLARLGH